MARVAQLVEAPASKPGQSPFESERGHLTPHAIILPDRGEYGPAERRAAICKPEVRHSGEIYLTHGLTQPSSAHRSRQQGRLNPEADARTRTGDPFITSNVKPGLEWPYSASSNASKNRRARSESVLGRRVLDALLDTGIWRARVTVCFIRRP
jgi:hypothetical protein